MEAPRVSIGRVRLDVIPEAAAPPAHDKAAPGPHDLALYFRCDASSLYPRGIPYATSTGQDQWPVVTAAEPLDPLWGASASGIAAASERSSWLVPEEAAARCIALDFVYSWETLGEKATLQKTVSVVASLGPAVPRSLAAQLIALASRAALFPHNADPRNENATAMLVSAIASAMGTPDAVAGLLQGILAACGPVVPTTSAGPAVLPVPSMRTCFEAFIEIRLDNLGFSRLAYGVRQRLVLQTPTYVVLHVTNARPVLELEPAGYLHTEPGWTCAPDDIGPGLTVRGPVSGSVTVLAALGVTSPQWSTLRVDGVAGITAARADPSGQATVFTLDDGTSMRVPSRPQGLHVLALRIVMGERCELLVDGFTRDALPWMSWTLPGTGMVQEFAMEATGIVALAVYDACLPLDMVRNASYLLLARL